MTWFRQSLTARTLAITGVFAVLIAAGFAALLIAVGGLREAGRAAVRAQQAVTAGTELQRSVVNLENGLRGYVASGRESLLEPFHAARRDYPREVRRLRALARDDPRLRADVEAISEQIDDYVNLWALPLLGIARDDISVARSVIVNTNGRRRVARVRAAFQRMFERAHAEARRKERRAERRSDVAVALGGAGIVLALALSAILARLLRRGILRPVQQVAQASGSVAGGDLSVRVPVARADELGDLARAFNTMTASLERSRVELARRADALERSNRELEDYASVTSHDLQGPLVTVGMYAEILAQRLADEPETRQLAEHIRDGAAGMRRLVRELLAYARLERKPVRPQPVALDAVLQEALDRLAGPIRDAGAHVDAEPLPVVLGDEARLAQLLQNLLANAIKFSGDAPPHVEVTGRIDGDVATISISDNGIGLPPEQSEVIFRPFQRLHSAESYEGTGIGLAVCHKIVDQHGGRIWAESSPGEGATFSFTLRLGAAPRDPALAPAPAAAGLG